MGRTYHLENIYYGKKISSKKHFMGRKFLIEKTSNGKNFSSTLLYIGEKNYFF